MMNEPPTQQKAPEDGGAKYCLGSKYGALPDEVVPLLQAAHHTGLTVAGVAFYAGSVLTDTGVYRGAIAAAKAAFDAAARLGLPPMRILDIGGGFEAGWKLEKAAGVIKLALVAYFGDEPALTVIAEPGRFFAETPFTLAANVIGKRVRGNLREYWINDGVYGSLNGLYNADPVLKALPLACESDRVNPACEGKEMYESAMFGPTCASMDRVLTGYQLPELDLGDWLVFPHMGAYSKTLGSAFNGFDASAIFTHLAFSNLL